jgi:hypothetical protein
MCLCADLDDRTALAAVLSVLVHRHTNARAARLVGAVPPGPGDDAVLVNLVELQLRDERGEERRGEGVTCGMVEEVSVYVTVIRTSRCALSASESGTC